MRARISGLTSLLLLLNILLELNSGVLLETVSGEEQEEQEGKKPNQFCL